MNHLQNSYMHRFQVILHQNQYLLMQFCECCIQCHLHKVARVVRIRDRKENVLARVWCTEGIWSQC